MRLLPEGGDWDLTKTLLLLNSQVFRGRQSSLRQAHPKTSQSLEHFLAQTLLASSYRSQLRIAWPTLGLLIKIGDQLKWSLEGSYFDQAVKHQQDDNRFSTESRYHMVRQWNRALAILRR
jgi:hypothetical protein